ncbi:MAG: DUF2124 domain-containing protein [Methanocalculus sp. MSAO_Arc1]|uniref:DUF2124 family protein n=1 Tax=Methanocalculus TaxID=71151 RepID=UPI000FED2BFB|nr:DUF2124 family protein [Methanocalculus sp. MSAO_Arc1]MCP1662686.1 hypothetical protein [Methanocalculus sp. AMF5]RQD80348.1 MAG: DUF2124 domain-containing protein [Methanocalculus sp. MSAO_Arc1]
MSTVTTQKGVPGILRPFKEYLAGKQLDPGSQVVYYGCVGTCTPFVELLAYATRDMDIHQVYVPLLDEGGARLLKNVPGVGIQAGERVSVKPAIIVLMGGLSMPGVPVLSDEAKAVVQRHGVPVVGICFMNMFERQGWSSEIPFELLIDATIDPVKIIKP